MKSHLGKAKRWLGVGAIAIVATAAIAVSIVTSRPVVAARPLAPSDFRQVDQIAIDDMAEYGTQVELLTTDESPEKAIAVAASSFGQTVGREPQEVSLARVTISHYRQDVDGDAKTDDMKVVVQDRRVWIVVFDHFTSVMSGPAPAKLREGGEPALTQVTRLVVFIDQETNEFLYANTVE